MELRPKRDRWGESMNFVKISLIVALMCLLALIEMIAAATVGLSYIVAIAISIVMVICIIIIIMEILKGRKKS
ncbi:hypothetical protein MUA90_00860 [Staphylococcus sp. IVB6181]|uniref:hypothetical protein n=2 Tax=Staphylococcus TaxID=1279 RepID=UPI0013C3F7CB|nr:hypothetical protein [Staphylococcus sp. EZ-P03]UXV35130.1 hypothetical protein MUA90_00860 [Staphylococcus sp. IVB6181]